MTNPAVASTQYGDFKGSISLDGFDGLTVFDLIKESERPKGYWPVRYSDLWIRRRGAHQIHHLSQNLKASVLCVDIEQTGPGQTKSQITADRIRSCTHFSSMRRLI